MADPTPDDDRTLIAPRKGSAPIDPDCARFGGQNALPPGTKLQEFEIERAIGEGGFSIVYLARDSILRRNVAIKEYLPCALATRRADETVAPISQRYEETFQAGLASFIKEAHALAAFDHPSLGKVFRFWEDHGTAYMAMPYYKGVTVKEALRQLGKRPDEAWLRAVLGPVMDAIEIIHAEGYIHRDIAPDNILLLDRMRPVLLDLGAARQTITDMNKAVTVILKRGYAPIEQYAQVSGMQQGPWTDIYALASVAYLAITGKPPVPAVERIVSDSLVPLSQCATGRYSAQFLEALDRAMAVKPEDRPRSIAQFRELIGTHSTSDRQRDDYSSERQDVASTRKPWMPAALAAAILLAVGAAVAYHFGIGFGNRIDDAAPATPQASAPDPVSIPPIAASPPPSPPTPAATTPPPVTATPAKPQPAAARTFQPTDFIELIYDKRDPSYVVLASPDSPKQRNDSSFNVTVQSPSGGYLLLFLVDSQSTLTLLFPHKESLDNAFPPSGTIKQRYKQFGVPGTVDHYLAVVTPYPTRIDAARWTSVEDFKAISFEKLHAIFGTPKWTPQAFIGTQNCPDPRPANCGKYGAARFTVETADESASAKR